MSNHVWTIVIVGALCGAIGFALGRNGGPMDAAKAQAHVEFPVADREGEGASLQGALPPNHPPVGDTMAPHAAAAPPSDDAAAITWKVPPNWKVAPNPNSMRIATYKVPAADRDNEDAEASVSRAGGTPEANIQRWLGQFDQAGQDTRAEETVAGLKVTLVEVSGTYSAGSMMGGAPPAAHPGWSLIGAIVQGRGLPYFFKLIGPQATLRAARPSFLALVHGITPS